MPKFDALQGISAPKRRKIEVTYFEEPLNRKSFSAHIEELTERLSYHKPVKQSAKDRFLKTLRKYTNR